MADVLSSSLETETVAQSDSHITEASVTVETADGCEHTIRFALDEERYINDTGHVDPLFLADHITEYNAFTQEAADACAEAYSAAVEELGSRVEALNAESAQTYEYTVAATPYNLHVTTYAPRRQTTAAEMPRPDAPTEYTFLRESMKSEGVRRFRVADADDTVYTITFDSERGYLSDAMVARGEPSAETITGLFDAVRLVQVAMINRGANLDPTMHIELYQTE